MPTLVSSSPRRVRLGIILLSACAATIASRGIDSNARDRSTALTQALSLRGISAAAEDVVWIDPPQSALGMLGPSSRAVVRAITSPGDPADLFLVYTELSPEGVLLGVRDAHNITDTSGADESKPVLRQQTLAYVSRPLIEGSAPTVHVFNLAGEPFFGTSDWTLIERTQNAITNWQSTGQIRGIEKRTFRVEPFSPDAVIDENASASTPTDVVALQHDAVIVRSDGRETPVSLAHGAELPTWIRPERSETARPGNLVTWAVDRVRFVIGDDAMQSIKAVAFTALEFILRRKEEVTGDTGAADIAADLGRTELDPPVRQIPVDPEIGWPPPPLEPWVTPPLEGEGQWNPQGGDAFVRKLDGLPPAIMTTFIRSDRSRKVTRVYIALWDPRQVELHMMAGTVEPKSATGEAGPGLIPRTPEIMKHVVAGSNAGFQALHGEFGMMADGVVYLPPKPYAATIAVKRDGSTVFGTWSEDQSIPDWMLSYRQNMTVMVQDQKFNPYGRTWWGGTAPGSADKTHTVRTGICLTKEQFVAYFYGADIGPDGLSQAMIQARCDYGIALDMNAGHSGLEFYHVAPEAELPPLGRPLRNDWEAEGEVKDMVGWRFRGRRLIRGMGLMNFPRYIQREARDFFYMTLRELLPGKNVTPLVSPPDPDEGQWRVKGLPHHGFPYALATTELRIPSVANGSQPRIKLLKIDPKTVMALPVSSGAQDPTVAIIDAPNSVQGDVSSLWYSTAAFTIGAVPLSAGAIRLVSAHAASAHAVAALGINDEDGMLLYLEITGITAPKPAPASSAAHQPATAHTSSPDYSRPLNELLTQLGCTSRLLLEQPMSVALGGDTDLSGNAVHAPSTPTAIRLVRAQAPGAGKIFENTPVVPFNVWYPLQQKRIRYFKKPKEEPE